MKKILTALAIASLAATPAMAHQRNHEHSHEHRHGGGNKWVAPLLGGLIIGALLSKDSNNRQEQQAPTYVYPPQTTYEYVPTCWYEERIDYYGNIRVYKVCR